MPLLGKIATAIGVYFLKRHAITLAFDAIVEAAEAGASRTDTQLDDKAVKALKDDREAILKIVKDFL